MLQGFPDGSAGKDSTCNVGDLGLIPRLQRLPGKGKGYPLQYSGLENSMDCIVHVRHCFFLPLLSLSLLLVDKADLLRSYTSTVFSDAIITFIL